MRMASWVLPAAPEVQTGSVCCGKPKWQWFVVVKGSHSCKVHPSQVQVDPVPYTEASIGIQSQVRRVRRQHGQSYGPTRSDGHGYAGISLAKACHMTYIKARGKVVSE